MTNIAVFASGAGSNAENITRHFSGSRVARTSLIITDNPSAGVIARAEKLGVPVEVVPRADFRTGGAAALDILHRYNIDYIVLAGFLSLVPHAIIDAYRGRIVNVHPALLPAYGGKGMYGSRVHEAVVAAGEQESGITVHHVDEHFDNGGIIAQFRVAVAPDDTPETLAEKIHALEYEHFPKVVGREIEILAKRRTNRRQAERT
jgi:phosphoribosylglycinamide formyltransferase-1